MRRIILRLVVAFAATALLALPHSTPYARAATAPTATFSKDSGWGTGYQGKYTITNGGSTTLTGWKVEFDVPAGGSVGAYWDALMTQSGTHYTFTNREYNGTLAPGASASFGWTGAPESATPINCRLNGQPCDGSGGGGGGGDTSPPTAPTGLRVTGTTSSSISLSWTASTDDVGVTGYRVYEGSTVVATTTSTSATIGGLAASSSHTYSVTARDAAGNESAKSATVSGTTQPGGGGGGTYQKVGYYPQWGIYGRNFWMKNLDTDGAAGKLTVLNYAFENLDPTNLTCAETTKGTTSNPEDPDQGTGAGDAYADYGASVSAANSVDGVGDTWDQKLKGNFNQIKKLKAKYPNLKVLVSIGGWTYSKFFSDAAKTDAGRKKLVSSCIDMFIKGNLPASSDGTGGPGTGAGVFDGIDVDWEWPGSPDGHPGNHYDPSDKANLTALLAEFRSQLNALGSGYLLTAFTPADPVKVNAGWDLPAIFNYLDFANVQGYDFHGSGSDNSWEPNRTGHQANLYVDPDDPYSTHFSVDSAVKVYTDAGVNTRKLTIGIPFYGRGWQQVADGGKNGEWQTANGAAPGDFPEEAGTRGYKNIAANVPGCTVYHDEQAVATYCYTGANGQWWSFDDPWSIGKKTDYIKSKNLLGAMIWEMSGDTGPLMTALDSGLH
ncbi:glycosyl hydrolase family 18 protein [Actinoallomurus soli]|uniref:glycosyl hydrolase family 18 protein n=1 Tax=Actinoallomurus soli TaxID=2952535 RepID=UPI002093AFA8|nr:glycosyl hydrolase family 18 protein [Actinoallomurus soli]MCO5970842.1 glycoside hydrolase family 18 chitinase [Actinoallomurus soli]